jgi:hypothetical protein
MCVEFSIHNGTEHLNDLIALGFFFSSFVNIHVRDTRVTGATSVKNLGGGLQALLPKLKITCKLLLLLYTMIIYFRFRAKLDLLQCVFFIYDISVI